MALRNQIHLISVASKLQLSVFAVYWNHLGNLKKKKKKRATKPDVNAVPRPDNTRHVWGGTQASVFLKFSKEIPWCSQSCESLLL